MTLSWSWSSNSMGRLSTKIARYFLFLRRLFTDGIWRFRRLVVAIWCTAVLAIVLQVAAIWIAFHYANRFQESDEHTVYRLLGRDFLIRQSPTLLVLFSAAVLVILLLASLAQYYSRRETLRLWQEYGEFCSRRAIEILARGGPAPRFGPNLPSDAELLAHVRSEPSLCGRVFSRIIGAFPSAAFFLAATVALFWLQPLLTLLLMVLLAIAGAFMFRVNVKAADVSTEMEQHNAPSATEHRRLLAAQKHALVGDEAAAAAAAASAYRTGAVGRYWSAYIGRLHVLNVANNIGGIFLAVAIFLMMVMLGGQIMLHGRDWGNLVLYLVALRYALVYFRDLMNRVTEINLFYPQVRRYQEFVEAAEAEARTRDLPRTIPPQYELLAAAESNSGSDDTIRLPGSLAQASLRPGQVVAVITDQELHRFSLPFLLGALLGGADSAAARAAAREAWFVTATNQAGDPLMRQLVAADNSDANVDNLPCALRDALTDASCRTALDRWREGASTETWLALPPVARLSLALAAALRSDARIIIIDEPSFALLPREAQAAWLRDLTTQQKIVIVALTGPLGRIDSVKAAIFAVHHKGRLIGLGDEHWLRTNFDRIAPAHEQAIRSRSAQRAADEDGEEVDIED